MSLELLAPDCQALLLLFDVDDRTGSMLKEAISVLPVRYNLLNTDVGVCGGTVVKPPASRTESMGARNCPIAFHAV